MGGRNFGNHGIKMSGFEEKADIVIKLSNDRLLSHQRPMERRYGVGLSTPVLTVRVFVFGLGIGL